MTLGGIVVVIIFLTALGWYLGESQATAYEEELEARWQRILEQDRDTTSGEE